MLPRVQHWRAHELWSSSQGSCRLPSLPVSSFSLLGLGIALASGWESRGCAVGGSAHTGCYCAWCVLSSVSSMEGWLPLAGSVGFVSGAAVQESGGLVPTSSFVLWEGTPFTLVCS